ncbi:lysophospholipid acyltransferase family protein [Hydrogenobaculum acidophilum]
MNQRLLKFLPISIRLLRKTIKITCDRDDSKDKSIIYALWHSQALAIAMYGIDKKIYSMASQNKDGNIAAYILEGLGFGVVRGSSNNDSKDKGGAKALIQIKRVLEQGHNVAITVDGPTGPPKKVKQGIVYLAQKTKRPIVGIYADISKYISLNSWDRFQIPLPFSNIRLFTTEEICVKENEDLEAYTKILEQKMINLELKANT